MRRRLFTAGLVATTHLAAWPQAARYPGKPIRWLVGFPAGGASDVVVRHLAEPMRRELGQAIVVDNRPGASGLLAVKALLQAPADGHTIMAAENTILMFNEHLYPKLDYSPERDFSYIAATARVPMVLVVHPSFQARTLGEFIAYARANPGRINYASAGNTSSHCIAMELFQRAAGVELTHIPYKGGLPAVQDVIGGQVHSMMFDLTNGLQNIRAGQVRPLAVASAHRIASISDVPAFPELGFKQVVASIQHGVVGPAAMPASAVSVLNRQINKAMDDAQIRQLLADAGAEPVQASPADFHRMVRLESQRWGEVIRTAGIRGD